MHTCVVGSNILVIHHHGHFADVYGFDKETQRLNAYILDATIAYKDPVTHLTVIIMIKQAIKIDSMSNIFVCPMQCQVHGIIVNKRPKFIST